MDGVIKKRGQHVWEIGVVLGTWIKSPTRSIVHVSVLNPDQSYASYEECKKACNKLNKQVIK